jgi:hypothetical protein
MRIGAKAARLHEVESVYVNPNPEERLNHADGQHRDVSASFPKKPSQKRDDGARHQENQEEAADVIRVSAGVAADRPRRKEMPEEPNNEERYTEPNPPIPIHCSSISA